MIEPIVLEFKIDDRFIDHPLLSKKELLKYDIDYCYKKVEEEVDKFISAQINYPFINTPTITCNYEVRYECFVPKKIDKVGNYVISKITKEEEIPEEIIKSDASQKEPENVPELEAEPEKPGAEPMAAIKMPELNIPASMKNMELSKPPNEFIRKANSSRFLLDQIKGSCVVKMARALDCAKEI